MRIEIDDPVLLASPERPVRVGVAITNTSQIIDAYSARIIGIKREWVRCDPNSISLFPDAEGRIELTITVPPEQPSGRMTCVLEVSAQVAADDHEHTEVQLIIEPVTEAELTVVPPLVSARHRGQFTVACTNTGNTTIELALDASDPQRVVRCAFEPPTVQVEPGATATAMLDMAIRRRVFGADVEHKVTVSGRGGQVEAGRAPRDGETAGAASADGSANGAAAEPRKAEPLNARADPRERVLDADQDFEVVALPATLKHKPMIPRGVATAAILAAIVALWAAAFLFGVRAVMHQDTTKTKAVPASFFAAAGRTEDTGSPPAGAVPKSVGSAPPGVAASVHGLVTVKATGAGVGRITVKAFRNEVSSTNLVASAATDSDGTYSIQGLFPGNYILQFQAQGFTGQVSKVALGAGADVALNVQVAGKPATLSGHVDSGSGVTPPVVLVQATPTSAKHGPTPDGTQTDGSGNFTIKNLSAPETYDLTFVAAGYQVVKSTETVNAGETHVANTVKLVAGAGEITGTVTDGKNPLGGVTISTLNKGKPVTATTPTEGAIGQFVLTGLESPQTYVITFTKNGYGTKTSSVDISPDTPPCSMATQPPPLCQKALNIALEGGNGTISGTVTGPSGAVGNATVTADGGTTEISTTTVTASGSFQLSGLPTPGTYAITVTAVGYDSQTTSVPLETNGFARNIRISLHSTLAELSGTVLGATKTGTTPLPGVAITVTDGKTAISTTSVSAPTAGGFAFPDLPAGVYSLTFHLDGYSDKTLLVTLTGGNPTHVTVIMSKGT